MSLAKALTILDLLSRPPFEHRLSDVSRETGINRTTVYRIVRTLAKTDCVIYSEVTKKCKIGPMLHHIGSAYLENFSWAEKVEEALERVAAATRESVGFAVREGDRVISLFEHETHQPFRMNYRAGTIYPMNRGCYGKCLMAYHDPGRVDELLRSQTFEKVLPNTLTEPSEVLAEYARIRAQGHVVSVGETLSPAAVGVGVPVFRRTGEVLGCMVVAFIKTDDYEARIRQYLAVLHKHAKALSLAIP